MRITQGYVSKSIMDFPFHQVYALDDYNADEIPSVFFGMYRYEDWQLFHAHGSESICFWTGEDARKVENWIYGGDNVTAHPPIKKYFDSLDIDCDLIKPSTFLGQQNPQKLGKKIYAYCPNSAPEYHGKKLIDELRCAGYEIIIGDGQWTQNQWRTFYADFHYSQCFIGLCLSEFAGGGTSIIEMGLRGMKVVTNVFDLPNCIPWKGIHDIRLAIEQESKLIGTTRASVARYTWDGLDHDHKWLEI